MSDTKGLHYKLCLDGAKFLKKDFHPNWTVMKYIAIELITCSAENTDLWCTDGSSSWVIEVKVSKQDFLRDVKKFVRKQENKRFACGNYRYYLTPKGMINISELPDKWGLFEWDNGKIIETKKAEKIDASNYGDLCILASIMRREGIKSQIFNYRNKKEKMNPQKINNSNRSLEIDPTKNT